MQGKLTRVCGDRDLIEDVIETLAVEGLQSDERFTESFVHQRIGKGQGPLKIRQELHQRGIDEHLIDQFLERQAVDWQAQAEKVRARKFGDQCPGDFQNKARQSRFLLSRGFSSEQVNRVLKSSGRQ